MRIPRKISPDRIIDSIIEIEYQSDQPYVLIVGALIKSLEGEYKEFLETLHPEY